MSAQLGKCGVNPALRNFREIRENPEIPEYWEKWRIPVHSEEKLRQTRTSSWITGLTEFGTVSTMNHRSQHGTQA